MSGKVLNKMMGFFGLDEEDEIDEELMDEPIQEEQDFNNASEASKKGNKVVNIHTAMTVKVVILKPKSYEEATNICDNLKNRRIVVVNTNDMEPKTAQRLLDFVSGACYALSAEIEEVEVGVYILSPSNVEVSSDLKSELVSKGIFSWTK